MATFLEKLSIYILWFAAVFDPIGTIGGLRYVALIFVFLMLLRRFFRRELVWGTASFYFWVFGLFVLIFPVYGSLVGMLRGGFNGKFIDTSYIGAAVLFSCSLIYLHNNYIMVGLRALVVTLRLLSLVTILIGGALFLNIDTNWVDIFKNHEVLLLSNRYYGEYTFYFIYFISSPMIVYLMVYEIWMMLDRPSVMGIVLSVAPVVALLLSGTRMNMLMAVSGPPLIFCWRKWGPVSVLVGFAFVVNIYIFSKLFDIAWLSTMFDTNEESNAIKIGFLKVYLVIFSDPVTFVFGQGLNAHIWSTDFANMIRNGGSRTELTYLEIFRVFGVIIGTAFVAIMLLIIKKIGQCDESWRWLSVAVFLYLCESSLNPYLFSSNGILPLGLVAAVLYMNTDQIRMNSKKQQEIS